MLEGFAAILVQKFLGNYVKGINKEALKISAWQGDVELKNMQLRPEALNALKLPVKVKAGFLGSVRLKVPWTKLGQEPVVVFLDRIFILAEPALQVEGSSEEALQEAKRNRVKNTSWLSSIINTIVGNLKLSVSNIHIRYEDTESNPGHQFAAGLTLGKLFAVTVDDQGNETFATGVNLDRIQKSVVLESLAFNFDSDSNPWVVDKLWEDILPSEWSQIAKSAGADPISVQVTRFSAAFNIQEALIWKEKIEHVIRPLRRRTTMGNGPPESVYDGTRDNVSNSDQVSSRKHWRLVRCQNGLRIFEELVQMDALPRSCGRAMKAVGVVEASCDAIFELIMDMGGTRYEWDCSFNFGSLVDEVDGHTAILYHRFHLDWYPMIVWPRDLCYVRYWRRDDDGSYVVLFQSREHPNCGPQPGFVRAHIKSGGFNISPLKSRDGKPRSQVQHLMQIDLKGWGVGYLPSFQQHCLLHMFNSVAGLREWFARTDGNPSLTRMPVMVGMQPNRAPSKRSRKFQEIASLPGDNVINRPSTMIDEESDDDAEYFHHPEQVQAPGAKEEKQKN